MKTRYFIWGSIAVVFVALLALGLQPQPHLVEVDTVVQDKFEVTIREEGQTRVIDRFVISSPVAGFARRIPLNIGDTVKQGQVLTELEPLPSDVLDPRSRAEAEAQVAAARSSLLAAREETRAAMAEADFADAEFERKKKLHQSKHITDEELELAGKAKRSSNAALRSAKFAVDVAQYQLDAASTLLQYSAAENSTAPVLQERVPIRAPVTGSILAIHRKSEGVVPAGSPLLEIGDPSALEVAIDVLSFDAVKITPGMSIRFEHWGGSILKGIVKLIEPVGFTKTSALGVEEQRVWVIANITSPFDTWQRLGDGYRIEAAFVLWQADNVLQIPTSSLFRYNNSWAVFKLADDKAIITNVTVGQQNGLSSQVISGLSAGDKVVVHPDRELKNGDTVKVQEI